MVHLATAESAVLLMGLLGLQIAFWPMISFSSWQMQQVNGSLKRDVKNRAWEPSKHLSGTLLPGQEPIRLGPRAEFLHL